ncbi:hypothetical protein EDC18_1097 [Natranaerovirga pectinivora]|uniref:Uncharacterized protein n=1 Tax=Natranaerovirga pectinivora TaxID=682400 RepID=A0A4R3MH53_9FIRM|nr:hypothetical protein [Natranaerovirga pectinivora]TCT13047.1 hypothetical protein EDC18_1097 [Natranaerovirga pectinivora]
MDNTNNNIIKEAEKILEKYQKQHIKRKYVISKNNLVLIRISLFVSIILLAYLVYQGI